MSECRYKYITGVLCLDPVVENQLCEFHLECYRDAKKHEKYTSRWDFLAANPQQLNEEE